MENREELYVVEKRNNFACAGITALVFQPVAKWLF
jgi:hypothetical protein